MWNDGQRERERDRDRQRQTDKTEVILALRNFTNVHKRGLSLVTMHYFVMRCATILTKLRMHYTILMSAHQHFTCSRRSWQMCTALKAPLLKPLPSFVSHSQFHMIQDIILNKNASFFLLNAATIAEYVMNNWIYRKDFRGMIFNWHYWKGNLFRKDLNIDLHNYLCRLLYVHTHIYIYVCVCVRKYLFIDPFIQSGNHPVLYVCTYTLHTGCFRRKRKYFGRW